MNIKYLSIFLCVYVIAREAHAQDYRTRTGQVSFRSEAAEELIEANNYDVAAQLIPGQSKGQFIIPIKSFKFKKALLQEHFNENYMESDVYPKATYKFTITDITSVDINRPGRYPVRTSGVLTIKETAREIQVPGYISVVDTNAINIEADFSLSLADYGIQIPALVAGKVAKRINVKVNTTLHKQ